MSEELKPCPFCGLSESLVLGPCEYIVTDQFEVVCLDCDISGPHHKDKQQAVRWWNNRYEKKDRREVRKESKNEDS